jgi:hypothetical protein
MAILLLTIPFMIVGLAIATVPVLLGMMAETRIEAARRPGSAAPRAAVTLPPDLGFRSGSPSRAQQLAQPAA